MKKSVSGILLVTSLGLSTGAFAATDESYMGVAYHYGSYDETGFPKANPTGLGVGIGKYISDTVALEGRLAIGAGDDTIRYSGIDITVELDNAVSLFMKGDIPLGPTANIYGLLGFTKGKITAKTSFSSVSGDDSGLSYGAGAEAEISDDLLVVAEYVFYLSESDYDYTGFNFGLKAQF